jgi:hypothetical protein
MFDKNSPQIETIILVSPALLINPHFYLFFAFFTLIAPFRTFLVSPLTKEVVFFGQPVILLQTMAASGHYMPEEKVDLAPEIKYRKCFAWSHQQQTLPECIASNAL